MIDVGQTVGNYKVIAKLGEGGMGTVFLAEHPVIGSKMALKAIHPEFARSPDIVSRFVTEAQVVNQVRHPHIVDITDFGTTPAGDFYFLMEYLAGETLSAGIGRVGAFSPARALNVTAQIADALRAAHEHGVVHRDLKPDNIVLVTRGGTMDFVKVLDFGLAKLMREDAPPSRNTLAGAVMGTPSYMSPEQCEGRAEIDHRTDVYSLGVILFELLTGRIPFSGRSYNEVIIKHVTAPPPSARSLVPELSPEVDAILARALAKDPAERFQTMSEFRAALLATEAGDAGAPTLVLLEAPADRLEATTWTPPAKRVVTIIDDDDDELLRPTRNRGPLFAVLGLAAAAALAFTSLSAKQHAGRVVVAAVQSAAQVVTTTAKDLTAPTAPDASDPAPDSDPPFSVAGLGTLP